VTKSGTICDVDISCTSSVYQPRQLLVPPNEILNQDPELLNWDQDKVHILCSLAIRLLKLWAQVESLGLEIGQYIELGSE
jgi:hypothetical protein